MPIPKDPQKAQLWRERQRQSHLGKRLNQPGHQHSEETKRALSNLFSGVNNPMYGKTHSQEARLKISQAHKGRISTFKGHCHTEESKRLQSEAKKGKPSTRKGVKATTEHRLNISNGTRQHALRGPDNPRWRGGISPANQRARYSFEMSEWRRQVFERAHFTCQQCGYNKGHILIAHHIQSFSQYPELRLAVSNGLAVCKPCHQQIHSV